MKIEKSIQDFIEKTRIKPALFIVEKSITKYRVFMDGWIFDKYSDIPDIYILREFQDGYKSTLRLGQLTIGAK